MVPYCAAQRRMRAMRTLLVNAVVIALLAAAPSGTDRIVFARVFPQPGQIGLFIASADGSSERPLLADRNIDYDSVWSPYGAWIVFTSVRESYADLCLVHTEGS